MVLGNFRKSTRPDVFDIEQIIVRRLAWQQRIQSNFDLRQQLPSYPEPLADE